MAADLQMTFPRVDASPKAFLSLRIFALNAEAYPRSSKVYDRLGEAYMGDGNKPQAIASYQKSLQLNPKDHRAAVVLQKLGVRQ